MERQTLLNIFNLQPSSSHEVGTGRPVRKHVPIMDAEKEFEEDVRKMMEEDPSYIETLKVVAKVMKMAVEDNNTFSKTKSREVRAAEKALQFLEEEYGI